MIHRIGLNLAFIDANPLTGPGIYARELTEELARLAPRIPDLSFIGYAQPSAMKHFSNDARALLQPAPDFSGRFDRVRWEQLNLPFRARRDRIDLLFSPAFVSPLWGARHLVATIHDMYYRVVPELIEGHQRRFWQIMIPLTARRCDAIIAVSDNTRRDIEEHLPAAHGRVATVRLASRFPRATRREARPPEAAAPYVLLVANVTANKNPAVVVDAIAHVVANGYPLRLVHVGKDNYHYLAEAARRLKVEDAVVQLGKIGDAHLRALYQHSLCTVMPSLYEGFGLPALEAQALGSPLICSNRGSLPETAGEGALFVDPTDPADIAQAIATLHDEPERRAALIDKGYANLERFSWQRTAMMTVDLFRRVLAGEPLARR